MNAQDLIAEAYADAWRRDRGCVAPLVDPACGPCLDHFGRPIDRTERSGLTFDHVNLDATRWPRWMRPVVVLCAGHHLLTKAGANWATSHREELRAYLLAHPVTPSE